MKTVTIQKRPVRISAPEIRGLETLRNEGWVSVKNNLYEQRRGGWGTSLLPTLWERWPLLGVSEVHVGDANLSRRVQRFFAAHPRASFAIVGNIKRINAILKQLEVTSDPSGSSEEGDWAITKFLNGWLDLGDSG